MAQEQLLQHSRVLNIVVAGVYDTDDSGCARTLIQEKPSPRSAHRIATCVYNEEETGVR